MLNYNHLHYFHVAATEGSVAAAAESLGVTQPTVSEQVRALERALGVNLFERTASGLKLTDAGKLAYEQTSVMFRAGERLVESLGRTTPDLPRTLRIGISNTVTRTTTTDFLLPVFGIDGCMPSIRTADATELVRELRGGELDLVLCESEPPESTRQGLELVPLARTVLVAVAPPDLVPGHEWRDAGLIHYRPTSSFRWDVETYLETHQLHPQIAAEADDPLFLVEAAARGRYIAVVPRSVARDAISNGRLVELASVESAHAGVYALFASGETAELARHAVELLVQYAAGDRAMDGQRK
ncbi:MAG TPA: LysR family transcriptional regulator [Kofleriaceae bacterium]|nr:LysR family transcriptional regulator [Kofleriaceae bacterium]